MDTIQSFIVERRRALKQTFEEKKSVHDKAVAEADKVVAKARGIYEAAVAKSEKAKAVSATELAKASSALEALEDEAKRYGVPGAKGSKKTTTASAAKKTTTVKAAPVYAAKPGPKPGKKTTAKKTSKTAGAQRALDGRSEVAKGLRPPIKDAIRLILGKRTLHHRDISAELVARKWSPASGDLKAYVPNVLSSGSKGDDAVFESVNNGNGRGYYAVRHGAPSIKKEVLDLFGSGASPTTTTSAKTKPAAKPAKKDGVRACTVCGVPGHNKRGHEAFVKAQQAGGKTAAKTTKAAAAPKKTAAPVKAKGGARACTVCGVAGHNKRGHEAFIAKGGKTTPAAKAAPAKKTAKAAPKSPSERGCTVCGVPGHNKRGHDKYVAAQSAGTTATKAAKKGPTVKDATKTTPAAKTNGKGTHHAAAKATKGAGEQKCSVCQALGHNKRGHDAFIAKQSGGAAKASTPKAAPAAKPAATKSAPVAEAPPAPASEPAVVTSVKSNIDMNNVDDLNEEQNSRASSVSAEEVAAFSDSVL